MEALPRPDALLFDLGGTVLLEERFDLSAGVEALLADPALPTREGPEAATNSVLPKRPSNTARRARSVSCRRSRPSNERARSASTFFPERARVDRRSRTSARCPTRAVRLRP